MLINLKSHLIPLWMPKHMNMKNTILEAIEVARDKGLIKLNRITYSRYKTLLDLISYGILKNKFKIKLSKPKSMV